MDYIRRLDDAIIDRIFQPLAWRIEARTGVNNHNVARFLLVLLPCGMWIAVSNLLPEYTIHVMSFAAITCVTAYISSLFNEHFNRPGFRNPSRGIFLGPLTRSLGLIAIFGIIVMPIAQPAWFFMLGSVGLALSGWFDACDRMPPGFKEELELRKSKPAYQRL